MTYAVANLHGNYTKYSELLQLIKFNNDKDILYVLGDVVDYGSESMELIGDMSIRLNVYPIAGEHDFKAVKMLSGFEKMLKNNGSPDADYITEMTEWVKDGGEPTLSAYRELDADMREGVIDYLSDMPLYEEVEVGGKTYLLLHAGIADFNPDIDLDSLEPEDFFSTPIDPQKKYFDDKIIIAGHTPTTEENGGDGRIFHGNGSILIDCGLAFGGALGCIRLEDGKEFYVR